QAWRDQPEARPSAARLPAGALAGRWVDRTLAGEAGRGASELEAFLSPHGASELAHRQREGCWPPTRARRRESSLGSALRPRARRDAERLRQAGRKAVASRTARLSRPATHRRWLENQGDAQADDDERGLPAKRGRRRGKAQGRPAEQVALAL